MTAPERGGLIRRTDLVRARIQSKRLPYIYGCVAEFHQSGTSCHEATPRAGMISYASSSWPRSLSRLIDGEAVARYARPSEDGFVAIWILNLESSVSKTRIGLMRRKPISRLNLVEAKQRRLRVLFALG